MTAERPPAADLPLGTLLTGIARGRGANEMMLALLALLHDKGVLTEGEVRQVVQVLAADMRDFQVELQGGPAEPALKG